MLLAVQGYFEAGRFITDTPIQIPERRKTVIRVVDETIDKEQENYIAYGNQQPRPEGRGIQPLSMNKIIANIRNSDGMPEGEPERMHFKASEAIGTP
jgi:hypothetical protein